MPKPLVLPAKIGPSEVRLLTWDDFPGEVDPRLKWSAHIFWSLDYQIDPTQRRITVQVTASPRSWAKEERKCPHLLNHEQGHYLIGTLCALQFQRRVDAKAGSAGELFQDMVAMTFQRTLKEYLEMERKYDAETDHRWNRGMQQKWDKHILDKLTFYRKIYDRKKERFGKVNDKKH